MAYLIDTNHCSYIINRDPKITDKLQSLSSETFGVSIITHAELLYMAERSARKEQNLVECQESITG
jgi:tRNA(fMet)-specific endonuclease VapC